MGTQLPIDHFNSNAGTFKNRWWFNDEHYQPGGPVILMDPGESDAQPFSLFLPDNPQIQFAPMLLAQKYNGIVIVWEHRYFGQSVPFVQVPASFMRLAPTQLNRDHRTAQHLAFRS
jgi:hypothetical protein